MQNTYCEKHQELLRDNCLLVPHASNTHTQAGPQLTLYVPGPVLREGSNELVLLEVEGAPLLRTGVVCLHECAPLFFSCCLPQVLSHLLCFPHHPQWSWWTPHSMSPPQHKLCSTNCKNSQFSCRHPNTFVVIITVEICIKRSVTTHKLSTTRMAHLMMQRSAVPLAKASPSMGVKTVSTPAARPMLSKPGTQG